MRTFLKKKVVYIILACILLDQLTKVAVIAFVGEGEKTILPSVMAFSIAENTGGSLGFTQNSNLSMIIMNVIILIVVGKFYTFQNKQLDKKMHIALPLILAGGISNLIDRIVRGRVIDFVHIGNLPIFNLADLLVLVGWVLFALSLAIYTGKELGNIRHDKKEENCNKSGK